MKVGDFLISKNDFDRNIYSIIWRDKVATDVTIIDNVKFIKNKKYLIVDINEKENYIKIEYKKGKSVAFSLIENKRGFEYYDSLFYLDTLKKDRKEKLLTINNISQNISFSGTTIKLI